LSENDKDKLKTIEEERKEILKYVMKLKTMKFINEVVKQIQSILKQKIQYVEFDTSEVQYYNVHFKNGQFFEKLQPDENQRKFTLGFLAYCLSGDTSEQIFKINIGYSASNGKSTELKIHDKVFPIYTTKLEKDTFMLGNTKRHKSISCCLKQPIRLAYIEELQQKKLDSEFLKDWVDGNKITNEVLYGYTESKKIQAKLMTCSNKDLKVDSDKGVLRRGKVQFYNSQFLDILEDDFMNHKYKKVNNFEKIFDEVEYKNAYFHLLLGYFNK
jgi:hypothetical protein